MKNSFYKLPSLTLSTQNDIEQFYLLFFTLFIHFTHLSSPITYHLSPITYNLFSSPSLTHQLINSSTHQLSLITYHLLLITYHLSLPPSLQISPSPNLLVPPTSPFHSFTDPTIINQI